ncbi:MAG: hypothetical protein LBF12_07035 [Christensenellaceae bacterium]|jgi:hypothetical protein|nr:hypothetical protein [Christensenellaceae bacterium]
MNESELGSYKKIARIAKRRMRLNDYADVQLKREIGINRDFSLDYRVLSSNEICNYYNRIQKLQSKEHIFSAVGYLLDFEKHAKLNPAEKERAVFAMGKLYREIKDIIENAGK